MTAAIAASKNTTRPATRNLCGFPQAGFVAAGIASATGAGRRLWTSRMVGTAKPSALAAHGFAGLPWFDGNVSPTRTGEQISRFTISHGGYYRFA